MPCTFPFGSVCWALWAMRVQGVHGVHTGRACSRHARSACRGPEDWDSPLSRSPRAGSGLGPHTLRKEEAALRPPPSVPQMNTSYSPPLLHHDRESGKTGSLS